MFSIHHPLEVRRQESEGGMLQLVLTFPFTIPLKLGGEGVKVGCCNLHLQLNVFHLTIPFMLGEEGVRGNDATCTDN